MQKSILISMMLLNMAILLKKENLIDDYIKKIISNTNSNYINETRIINIVTNGDTEALKHIENALSFHPKLETKDKDYLNTKSIKADILSSLEKYNESILFLKK